MTDFKYSEPMEQRRRDEVFEIGGLRFVISSNDYGANLAVFGDLGQGMVELVRFQDYVDDPHYHAPVGGWYAFDRAKFGEPLEWWLTQLRDHLPEWLERSGFGELAPSIDFDIVSSNVGRLRDAMVECVPDSFERVPGRGIQRIEWSTDQSAFQKRNEQAIEFGGLRFEIFFDRDMGATMEVFVLTDDGIVATIRLDDYDENPHYHAPVGQWYNFDRAALGEPLAWFIEQVRDHLPAMLERSRAVQLIPVLDFAEITANADKLYAAMAARVPRGCVRIPGIGLQRVEPASVAGA
jgi:hypothetical protein